MLAQTGATAGAIAQEVSQAFKLGEGERWRGIALGIKLVLA